MRPRNRQALTPLIALVGLMTLGPGRGDDLAQLALQADVPSEFLPTYRPLFAPSPIMPGAKLAKEWILRNNTAITDRPDSAMLPAGTSVTLDESSISERLIRVRGQFYELCLPRSSIEPKP